MAADQGPLLLFTVDVEEDMPGWEITEPISVRNVSGLRRLAETCDAIGVQPTYLCTYPVVRDERGAEILRELHHAGGCELGTHLHPWNTPPFQGLPGRDDVDERRVPYYQYELGRERFRAKLRVLHDALTDLAGEAPISFRAGRFGIDAVTLSELLPLGYVVDSSVTPLESHVADDGPDFRFAPQLPYRPHANDVARKGDMEIVEIPVSVALTRHLPEALSRAFVRIPKRTHLRGLLSRDFLRAVDFAWLYPVRFDLDLMSRAAAMLVRMESPVLNVFVHSSELVAGASGRVQTQADVEVTFARIRAILEYCQRAFGARPATLGAAGLALRAALGLDELPSRHSA